MATTHEARPGTVFVNGLAGSSVWWPGTDSDLEETGRGRARQAILLLPALPAACPPGCLAPPAPELAVPWAVTGKQGQASSVNAPELLRGRKNVSEGLYLHLQSCFCSNSGGSDPRFTAPRLLKSSIISASIPAEYQKSEHFG